MKLPSRTQEILERRTRDAAARAGNLLPGEQVDPTTGEITKPQAIHQPAAKIRWRERIPGQAFVLSEDGVFCIEGSRVQGLVVYTAWKRSTLRKWLLGTASAASGPDDPVKTLKALCDLCVLTVPEDRPCYELPTDFGPKVKEELAR